ncbi:peptidylprolyl isomerase [Aquibium carbonis]|uniref:Parvulin-like PPIase n=1 Tax=Aquibium carbonis TaxID=2495581 RepID=A0A429Z2A3_9HYPH|nr:SurA N-terminal domain-containing protein [Aquibium carbonis]RST87841.1 peptidylprolyl isomerase [Aquibium carbonis]
MLDSLRSAAGTWVAKALLLLLVLSFAVWGISGQTGGMGGSAVVTAGDTTVTPIEYRLAYDRQLSVLSQRFGTRVTREQAVAMGVDQQVLSQLVAGAVLDEQARLMNLGVSKDRVAVLTAEDPAFRGPGGSFDRRQFEFVLRQIGMRPEDYLRNREQVAVRQQIVEAISDGMSVPDTFLRAVALYQGEDRTVEYLVLPRALVEPVEAPSDQELSTYFEENMARYAAPEYRKIDYVKLEPVDIADPSAITDEQVEADYQRTIAAFTTPERRTIDQIVFLDDAAARIAADRLSGGATFEQMVEADGRSMDDVRLGTVEKARVPDPAIAEAAFSLATDEVSGIVDGAFGPAIVRVTEIIPETVKPLGEVQDQIRQELALAEANRILLDVHDSYEDARAAGNTMQEAAASLGLSVATIESVSRAGQDPAGGVLRDIPESAALLRAAFETDIDVENPPVNIGGDGFLYYEVRSVTPARNRELAEIRDRVVADWTATQVSARLAERAGEIEKRLKDGASLDDIAAELGYEKQVKRGIRRGATDPDLGETGVASVYGVAEGGTGLVPTPSGDGQIVFEVTEVFEPAGASAESVAPEMRQAFQAGWSDDLLDQMVADLQERYRVTVNQTAIQQALSF